jgi:signal transduction histidine kinase
MNPASDSKNHRARLLVVDDMEINRKLMSEQFARHGYVVTEAESGTQALQKIEEEAPDLVLLDIRMPEMDGIEALQRIRKTHSALALPVIMVTAEDLDEIIVEALQFGANDYLIKPMNVSVAIARIEAHLGLSHMATIKDDIVRFASHDLKKPLFVMLEIAQTLSDKFAADPSEQDETRELLDLLQRTGQNMQGVISGFLDHEVLRHDPEQRNYQPLDINKVVLCSLESNKNYSIHKGITLMHELAETLPMVTANEFRLLQILENLIGNALKFCPRGSSVNATTGVDDGEVYVEVSDNGPGLSEDDFAKLFTKHARLSNRPTGGETSTGVGLALCKQLVSLDHGSICARNNPDAGITFRITLPVVESLEPA